MPQILKFKLISRPFYGKDGDIITDMTGRTNHGDRGGGKVYPDIAKQKDKILEWHEKDGVLFLKLDITETEAEEIRTRDKALKYKASPKVLRDYNHKDFKTKRLTDKEAEKFKEDFFGIKPESVESGVTP